MNIEPFGSSPVCQGLSSVVVAKVLVKVSVTCELKEFPVTA